MKIRMKLSVMMIVVTLISTALMGIFTYTKSTGTIMNLTESSMEQANTNKAQTIAAMIDKEKRSMQLVAGDSEIVQLLTQAGNNGLSGGNPLQSQVNVKLQGLVKDAGNLEHMFVVDLKGTAVADSDTKLVGANFSDRNYTKNVLKTGMPVISETLKSKSTGAYILAFVHPVMSGEKMVGFVASAVRADSLVTYLADAKVAGAPSSYAYLVDETGNTLYHPNEKKIGSLVENESIKAVVERVKAGRALRMALWNIPSMGPRKKRPTPCSRRRNGPWC